MASVEAASLTDRGASGPVVLSVAFPYAVIGPRAVGGAEVICSQMETAMSSLGYRSVIVAHADSQTHGKLFGTTVPVGTITDDLRAAVEATHQANIERACAEEPVALVHMHGLDFHRYRVPEHLPVLVTLHLPPAWYPETIWDLPSNYHLVCVSESQRRACPAAVRERIRVVGNGVAIPGAASLRPEGRYALMLARICPEKNLHSGLDAARLAGMPAILGGEVFPYAAHEQYFREEIAPRLSATGEAHERRGEQRTEIPAARFVGPVSQEEKARVLSRAACLLLPSLAPETSSLVAMEALAAGVPVIGMAVGAVPEIVEHGRTGFLVSPGERSVLEMAEGIRRLPELRRDVCHAEAAKRFPLSRMLEGYTLLYRRLAIVPAPEPDCMAHRASGAEGGRLVRAGLQVLMEDQGSAADICLQVLQRDQELFGLEREWIHLWEVDSTATPFQHPAWLLPWWRQFGPDGTLHAVALRTRSAGSLVGFAPLYTYQNPETKIRQLLLIGAGTTDYLDGVWAEQYGSVPDRVLQHALDPKGAWDVVSLHQLRAGSMLKGAADRRGLRVFTAEPTSQIDLGAELPAKIRANVSRCRRRARTKGELLFEVASSVDEALASFEALVRLHSERWRERGEPGVLSDPRVLAHHREAVPQLLAAGLLRIFRLSLCRETVGILYALADAQDRPEKRLYLYLIGFDRRFADVSPGTLLLHEIWSYARANGFHCLDLLRGGEAYKTMWGAKAEPTFGLEVAPASERESSNEAAAPVQSLTSVEG